MWLVRKLIFGVVGAPVVIAVIVAARTIGFKPATQVDANAVTPGAPIATAAG